MKVSIYFLIILSILVPNLSIGQASGNPFDIQNRSEPAESTDEAQISSATDNPFDIRRNGSIDDAPILSPSNFNKPRDRNVSGNQLGIALGLVISLALLLTFFRGVFNNFFESTYRDRKFNQFFRRIKGMWVAPHVLLYTYFFLGISVFIYLAADHYGYPISDSLWKSIGIIALSIALFYIVKHILIFYLGNTFAVKNESSRYSFLLLTFNITVGVLITPVNLLLLLGPESLISIVFIASFILLGIIILLLLLRSFSIGNKLLLEHPMHFFAYLCTIEIAPLFIVAKLLT